MTESRGLFTLRQGTGAPLVLVHGYLGGAAQWQAQIEALRTGFDVIAPELAGYGGSAAQLRVDSIEGFARQVLAFLTERGGGEVPPSGSLDGRHDRAADGGSGPGAHRPVDLLWHRTQRRDARPL